MKKKLLYLFFALLVLSSCEKIFINGDLDGMWRMQSIEKEDTIIFPKGICYSFQRHLVFMGIYSENETPANMYMGCFTYEDGKIVMDNFYRYPGLEDISIPEELEKLYIYDSSVCFDVENLSKEKLIISTDSMRYVFRKW